MSFSFLGSLASLLPGYVQGQRQAVQDNWQDLMNYNQVQSGQLSNAFTEATWQPRMNMFYENALRNNLQLQADRMNLRQMLAIQPWLEMQGLGWSLKGPENMWYDPMAYGAMGRRTVNGNGNLPSALGG